MMNISCEFEISTNNTVCSRGPTKLLGESKKNARGSHLVFQNEAKNIPPKDFMVMNISCKFENSSNNFFFVRAASVKSFYTLWRRCNEAKFIVSTGCYQVDTMRFVRAEICIMFWYMSNTYLLDTFSP